MNLIKVITFAEANRELAAAIEEEERAKARRDEAERRVSYAWMALSGEDAQAVNDAYSKRDATAASLATVLPAGHHSPRSSPGARPSSDHAPGDTHRP